MHASCTYVGTWVRTGAPACSDGRPIAGSKLVVVDLLHFAAGPLGAKDAHDFRSELPISACPP